MLIKGLKKGLRSKLISDSKSFISTAPYVLVPPQAQVSQMYAQIVYKDKNLLELNNKILELERRLIDLQEFVGEKNEVIRGRDKVIQVSITATGPTVDCGVDCLEYHRVGRLTNSLIIMPFYTSVKVTL